MAVRNTQTGQIIQDVSVADLNKQFQGAEVRGGWEDYSAPTNPNINANSPTNPVSSSTDYRAGLDANKSLAGDLSKTIQSATTYQETPEGLAAQKQLADMRANLGVVGDQEQARINAAGEAAGREYDPLIQGAQEEKRKGMPKAIIGAGERGGFMSTQFAGAAALAPTEGGTFVGEGGELNNIKSVYDMNINNLQAKKLAAIAQAKALSEQAIRTGKREDLSAAQDAFNEARQANQDSINLAQEKISAINNYQSMTQKQTTFNQEQEAYQGEKIANKMLTELTGDPYTDNQIIQNYANEGKIDVGTLRKSLIKIQDEQSFYKSSDLINFAKTVPAGETKEIKDPNTGRMYSIIGTEDPQTVQTVDDKGVIRIMDKMTMKVISQSAPGMGKTKTQASNVTINAVGGRTPVYKDGKQIGYQTYNDKTGKTSFASYDDKLYPSDASGKLPSGASLGTLSAGNPNDSGEDDFSGLFGTNP